MDIKMPRKFLFLQPNPPKTTSVLLILLIIGITAFLSYYYIYIFLNWETEKCKEGRFFIAPLFGQDSEVTLDECLKKKEELAIHNALKDINIKISSLEDSMTTISNEIKYAEDIQSNQNTSANISNSLQQNIIYVRNALNKILSAVIVSTHMNNGILSTTQSLNNSSLSNIINSFNSVQSSVNTDNSTTLTYGPATQ